MGIDASIDGDIRTRVSDPKGLVPWLVSLPTVETTVCLRFVDHYGQTIFNRLQLPVLKEELVVLRTAMTVEAIGLAKDRHLASPTKSAAPRRMAVEPVVGILIEELKAHVERLIALVEDCIAQGPHHIVCFVGD